MSNTKHYPAPLDAVVAYSEAYAQAIKERFDAIGRDRFPNWGQIARSTIVYECADAFATFYLVPPPRAHDFPSGMTVRQTAHQTLNVMCQSASLSRIKILPVTLGVKFTPSTPPPDIDPLPEGSMPWMVNDDVCVAILDKTLGDLPATAFGPIVHYEQSISMDVQPTRIHMWSPVINIPGIGTRRQYNWIAADFWWKPEQLNLSETAAVERASLDLASLEAMIDATGFVTPNNQADATIKILEAACHEFEQLLDTQGDDEAAIHDWLKEPRHQLFWGSDTKHVWSKIRFGHDFSDFVLQSTDGTYTLVEIESATKSILTPKTLQPSQAYNHAVDQLGRWRVYTTQHLHELQQVQGLSSIYNPKSMMVIGRASDLQADDYNTKTTLTMLLRDRNITVLSYDDLLERVRNLIHKLKLNH